MSAPHDHRLAVEFPGDDGAMYGQGRPVDVEAVVDLIAAGLDGCRGCQTSAEARVAADPLSVAKLVEMCCRAMHQQFGFVPPTLTDPDAEGSMQSQAFRRAIASMLGEDTAPGQARALYAALAAEPPDDLRAAMRDAAEIVTGYTAVHSVLPGQPSAAAPSTDGAALLRSVLNSGLADQVEAMQRVVDVVIGEGVRLEDLDDDQCAKVAEHLGMELEKRAARERIVAAVEVEGFTVVGGPTAQGGMKVYTVGRTLREEPEVLVDDQRLLGIVGADGAGRWLSALVREHDTALVAGARLQRQGLWLTLLEVPQDQARSRCSAPFDIYPDRPVRVLAIEPAGV